MTAKLIKFGGWYGSDIFKEKSCAVCSTLFKPKSGVHKFCSPQCKGKSPYILGKNSTELQYKSISGNWSKYFSRLVNQKNRQALSVDMLLEILEEQKGRCALSGAPITCVLNKGTICKTNASIDQIIPSGGYTRDNIQLVCRALNSWRGDTNLEEFIDWCKKVADFNGGKVNGAK